MLLPVSQAAAALDEQFRPKRWPGDGLRASISNGWAGRGWSQAGLLRGSFRDLLQIHRALRRWSANRRADSLVPRQRVRTGVRHFLNWFSGLRRRLRLSAGILSASGGRNDKWLTRERSLVLHIFQVCVRCSLSSLSHGLKRSPELRQFVPLLSLPGLTRASQLAAGGWAGCLNEFSMADI